MLEIWGHGPLVLLATPMHAILAAFPATRLDERCVQISTLHPT